MKKHEKKLKRFLSGLLALSLATSLTSVIPASADEKNQSSKYPYAVFAADDHAGISLNLDFFTLNGNGYTNGTYSTTAQYPNINGSILDKDDIDSEEDSLNDESNDLFDVHTDMIYIHNKLINSWFTENCQTYDEEYSISEMNINLNSPVYVSGKLSYYGNVVLNTAIGAVSDITLSNGNLNGNNAIIYSKFGDIKITDSQASMNGLIYAPFGTVTIECDSFNINGMIIAQNVVINSRYGANINYNNSWAEFVGTETEELSWTYDDWKFLADTDEDGLPSLIEKEIGSDQYNPDSDGDLLLDGYEVLTLGTDPLKPDTDGNEVSDYDEDFDTDGLSNGQEYELTTKPYCKDTDRDALTDGDEVNIYSTDPLVVDTDSDGLDDGDEIYFDSDPNDPDSDDNGVLDGEEKRFQTLTHKVKNEECAITDVIVSMEATGNLEKTTTIESIMNRDMLCTDVVGLVGEPFSIETTSRFDNATLTFVIDKNKLGEIEFDNLLFLWYNEDEFNFVELETILDEENSTVSVETTHFSKYMVVDKRKWFDAWAKELYINPSSSNPTFYYYNTVFAIDCSDSMNYSDTITINNYHVNSYYDSQRVKECQRISAVSNYILNKSSREKIALVFFEDHASIQSPLSNDGEALIQSLQNLNDIGLTNFYSALNKSYEVFDTEGCIDANNTINRIILLSDGYDLYSAYTNNLLESIYGKTSQDKRKNIAIYTIGLGSESDNNTLESIARITNGKFYKAQTASQLNDIYSTIALEDFFDPTDTDNDKIPDIIEKAGIRLQNGTVIDTDYLDPDTDDDGLSDGIEIQPVPQYKTIINNIREADDISGYYFVLKSNPKKNDTDNDEYSDYWEVNYYNSNPLVPDVIKHSLSSQYVSINGSFGGDQDWYDDSDFFSTDYIIHHYGCGLISISDVILYLSNTIKTSFPKNTLMNGIPINNIPIENYMNYTDYLNYTYFKAFRYLGVDGFSLKKGFNEYCSDNNLHLSAKWGVDSDMIHNKIFEMIDNDIPVTISIGPDSNCGVNYYSELSKSPIKSFFLDNKIDVIKDHYVTITCAIEDKIKDSIILEISTWGKKRYIYFDDYIGFINHHSNYLFSNILYIYPN